MVHTRDLRYFLAVADQLHITRAAASLFITQPALSKQMSSLERSLGTALFDRRPDGVALTSAGQALVPYAQQMVQLDEDAISAVQQAGRAAAKLTVGFWLSPANAVLAPVVAAMATRHPEVRLRLRRADWAEPAAGVVTGRADVGLVEAPHGQPARGLRHHLLAVEDLVVAVGAGHRLGGQKWVVPADLSSETLLVLPQEAGALSGLGLLPPGTAPRTETVTTIDETLDGITLGLGVCILTPSVLAAHPRSSVHSVPLRDAGQADYYLVWREADEHRPEIQHLVEELLVAHRRWSRDNLLNGDR